MSSTPDPRLAVFSDADLYAELHAREAQADTQRIRAQTIGGFTVKDLGVRYARLHDPDDPKEPFYFSFYLLKDGKELDLYYDCNEDWCPKDKYGSNELFTFVPEGFAEACENAFDYHGTTEEAIAKLRECGFERIEGPPHRIPIVVIGEGDDSARQDGAIETRDDEGFAIAQRLGAAGYKVVVELLTQTQLRVRLEDSGGWGRRMMETANDDRLGEAIVTMLKAEAASSL